MRKWAVVVVGVVAMVAHAATSGQAAPILGCPVGADCNGTSVGAELISLGGTSYRIDVVFDFSGYRGQTTDLLHAVSIKNQATSVSNAAFTFAGLGSDPWMLTTEEMGADGCGGGAGGSRLCAQAAGFGGANVFTDASQTATFSFLFDAAGAVHDGVHIKHLFTYVSTGQDKHGTGPDTLEKRGSLGSYVVPFTTDKPDPSPRPIPEPAVLALFGLGLLGAGLARRRRPRTSN